MVYRSITQALEQLSIFYSRASYPTVRTRFIQPQIVFSTQTPEQNPKAMPCLFLGFRNVILLVGVKNEDEIYSKIIYSQLVRLL